MRAVSKDFEILMTPPLILIAILDGHQIKNQISKCQNATVYGQICLISKRKFRGEEPNQIALYRISYSATAALIRRLEVVQLRFFFFNLICYPAPPADSSSAPSRGSMMPTSEAPQNLQSSW